MNWEYISSWVDFHGRLKGKITSRRSRCKFLRRMVISLWLYLSIYGGDIHDMALWGKVSSRLKQDEKLCPILTLLYAAHVYYEVKASGSLLFGKTLRYTPRVGTCKNLLIYFPNTWVFLSLDIPPGAYLAKDSGSKCFRLMLAQASQLPTNL